MKKVLSFIIAISLFTSMSCEKEKDIALSEYVIGEWKTPTMYVHNAQPAWYEIEISNTTYSISKTNGSSYIAWPNKSYSVSNENNTITIKTFDIEPSDIIYKVTLTEDPNMMIWTTEVNDGVTFIWEKL
jgi:hypothetical protein